MYILVFLLMIIIGIVNLIFPAFAWQLRHGWMVRGDSEPSDTFLILTRIGGVVAIVIGVSLLMASMFVQNYN
ncbi:hypothetical protein D3C73_484510 [compost metagenome]